jgi:hypothetical protein
MMPKLLARTRSAVGRPESIVLLTTVGVAALGLIEGFLYASTIAVLLRVVGLCALLGAFLGAILATDPRSGFIVTDRPVLRAAISAGVGLIAAMVLGLSVVVVLLISGVTAGLGWLGMTWVQYVDF